MPCSPLRSAGAALTLLALSSCAIGPNYRRPATATPEAFRDQQAAEDRSFADLSWWQVYREPVLTELIRSTLGEGYDVRIAAARVEQARAIAAEARGQFFPALGYEANADRGRNAQLGNAFTQGNGTVGDGFDGYLAAAWELDLWGRVRRLNEQARAQYLSSEEARRGVILSVVTGTAVAYYQLLELDEELAIAHQATDSFRESLRLFNQQLQGGVVSKLDTESAEAATASSAARIPAIEMEITVKENQICALAGRTPGPVARGAPLTGQTAAPEIPAGLPSQLLERRPDVRQAEEQARAANAGIGLTLGGFLPRIGLSAILGAVSPSLHGITSRNAGLWSIGAQATGPLFQGGGLTGQYTQAKAAWEEAKLRYQQTALNAFEDVANILVTRQKLAAERVQQERAVAAYQEAVKLSTERYKAGRASYFEVLQAQQLLFPAEVTLAEARRDEFIAVAQLYSALGGGWKLKDGGAAAPAAAP